MNTISSLTGANFRTYNLLLQPTTAHELSRRDVTALLRHLGEVAEYPEGELTFSRNGHTHLTQATLDCPAFSAEALTRLRRFLVTSETPRSSTVGPGPDLLLTIGQAGAQVLQIETVNGVPARLRIISVPAGEAPPTTESASAPVTRLGSTHFFEPVAAALKTGGRILVLGGGTGMRSGLDQFVAWLHVHHPQTASRIIDVISVDAGRLAEAQLLTKIRAIYRSALG